MILLIENIVKQISLSKTFQKVLVEESYINYLKNLEIFSLEKSLTMINSNPKALVLSNTKSNNKL